MEPYSVYRIQIHLFNKHYATHSRMNELCHLNNWHIIAYILTNVNILCQVYYCHNKKRPLMRVVHYEAPLVLAVILDGVSMLGSMESLPSVPPLQARLTRSPMSGERRIGGKGDMVCAVALLWRGDCSLLVEVIDEERVLRQSRMLFRDYCTALVRTLQRPGRTSAEGDCRPVVSC